MREFIYYSGKARTSGNFTDLMKAGRMDIVCNVIISVCFLSHKVRDDVSKKDVAGLLKRMLYKVKPDRKVRVFPGCFVEKKSFQALMKELEAEGKKILVLDKKGSDIRESDLKGVLVIGDHEGLPKKEVKRFDKLSIGKEIYFASQTITIINNELDRRI